MLDRTPAAAVEHIPPKGQQMVRYYGHYSNKRRGLDAKAKRPRPESPPPPQSTLPAPPAQSARALRPLWRDLIRRTWGADPLECPCCHAEMKPKGKLMRPEEIQFFLRLHGLWEGVIALPPPPDPPYDLEKRRGIGGVLDAGEAGARRESPPGGAGESNHGTAQRPARLFLGRRNRTSPANLVGMWRAGQPGTTASGTAP